MTQWAKSDIDSNIGYALTYELIVIQSSSGNITNNEPVSGSAPGEGIGPEATPVTEETLAPGGSAIFRLYVNNTGGRQDSYSLAVSDENFTPGKLPAGWQVSFFKDGGASDCSSLGSTLTQTTVVPAGDAALVCALVEVPETAEGGQSQDLYFRARSGATGAQDIKLDRITVVAGPAISLNPDQQGMAAPGGSVVYTHLVRNNGDVALTAITLVGTPDMATDQWSIVLYEDTDGDGAWSGADTLVQSGDTLLTANSNGELLPDESVTVFARIFAPATAALGTVNVKTLSAEAQGGGQSVSDTASDTTTVSNTDVSIQKRQALDENCDGQPDGPGACMGQGCFILTTFAIAPDQCVLYQLEATNTGAETLFNVTVSDTTQSYTVFHVAATGCASPVGSCDGDVQSPPDGGTGDVYVNVGELAPGEQATLIFGLRVE
ncbi:MAG: hypothetical protein ACFE0K_16050 [Alcanivorax sp.]|uniref:hypothetical protein n=1 Tax=Alcanivorax sp. TaxID=1872427 RepID=UPI003DA7A219